MKKKILLCLTIVLALGTLTGCGKKEDTGENLKEENWTYEYINTAINMSDEQSGYFYDSLETYNEDTYDYTLVAYLGNKEESSYSGDYAYLIFGTNKNDGNDAKWAIAIVNVSSNGDRKITQINEIDIKKYGGKSITKSDSVGKWELRNQTYDQPYTVRVEQLNKLENNEYTLVAALAYQVHDDGYYFELLCEKDNKYYVVTLAEDAKGNVNLVSTADFALSDYLN